MLASVARQLMRLFIYCRCKDAVLVVAGSVLCDAWVELQLLIDRLLFYYTSMARSSMMRMTGSSLDCCELFRVNWILDAFIIFTCFLRISRFPELCDWRFSDFRDIIYYSGLGTDWRNAYRIRGTKLCLIYLNYTVILLLKVKVLRPWFYVWVLLVEVICLLVLFLAQLNRVPFIPHWPLSFIKRINIILLRLDWSSRNIFLVRWIHKLTHDSLLRTLRHWFVLLLLECAVVVHRANNLRRVLTIFCYWAGD